MVELEVKTAAIILFAGSGARFGHPVPKQFHRLSGKKVYQHTLDIFIQSQLFNEIILVCHPDYLNEVQNDHPHLKVIPGGATRQQSSRLGLDAAKTSDIVVIHDGARPFVTADILKANIDGAKQFGAVNTCISSSDTIVHSKNAETINAIPSRSEYLRGQTPQSFQTNLILQAHTVSKRSDATDDCQLVHQLGHPVHIVEGSTRNIKITSEIDLFLAEQLLRLDQQNIASPSKQSLKNKIYAITGGTGSIGIAIQKELEALGAKTILLSRSSKDYPVDLCSPSETENIFTQIKKHHGPIDGLINSVGKLLVQPVHSLSTTEIDDLIETNLTSLIRACRLAPLKPTASIINIASSSYSRGRKDYAIYSSAKAAVVNFTQALAEECPTMKINALVPGRVNSPMRKKYFPTENPNDLLQPHDVAKAVSDLLSNADITGSILEVRK